MCTALALKSKKDEIIFGRTMDFSYELDPEVYIIPRNYEWVNSFNNFKFTNPYKIIGTGQNIGKVILVDGINEMGLGVAALYFQGEAYFEREPKLKDRITVGSIEMVNFLLGQCGNVDEVINILNKIDIVGVEDSITSSVAPLHWFVVDRKGKCITIEQTKDGLHIYDNPVQVLTNSPNFNWHMTNLKNYISLSPFQIDQIKLDKLTLKAFGQGGGFFGMPGDYTSPSRFIRIVFQKNNVEIPDNTLDVINTCFNLMKTVSIPKGVVITNRGTNDYTQYTTFMNIATGDYYLNTYYNNQIFKANINSSNATEIVSLGKLKRNTTFEHI